jgi:septum formation protein
MTKRPLLLLASNSPRRRQLLALGGWMFGVEVSDLDETRLPGEAPEAYVRRLAGAKARAVLPRAREEHLVIGADTSVVIDGEVLGKPVDEAEARQMLLRLRGRSHQVYTGIAVVRASDGCLWDEVVITEVPMRAYSDAEIDRYIESGDPLDKAGAYGIQNPDFQPVASMSGCYASVMGLPLCNLSRLLRQAGAPPRADLAGNCQSTLNYTCPISRSILHGEPEN